MTLPTPYTPPDPPFLCPPLQYGLQHTALHKLNGAATLLTFLGCRVLLFPYLYWAYGRHIGVPLFRVPSVLPPAYNMAAAALTSKGLGAAWKRVTGNEPPTIGPESEDTLRNVIVWTVITSVVGALVSVGIARAQRRFFS